MEIGRDRRDREALSGLTDGVAHLLAFDFAKPTVAQLFVRFLFAFPFSFRTDGAEADATDFPGRGD